MTSRIWFLLGPAVALIVLTPLLHYGKRRLSAFAVNVLLVSEAFLLFLIVFLLTFVFAIVLSFRK